MYVRAEELRPAGCYSTSPMQKFIYVPTVPREDEDKFWEKVPQYVAAAGCNPKTVSICSLNQEKEFSEVFWKTAYDWNKLPDWPTWSDLMASEPLGNP